MIKLFVITFLMIVSSSALAEEKIYVCNQNVICEGLDEGDERKIKIYDSKTMESVSGVIRQNYDNGNIKQEQVIKNGEYDGLLKAYYENGMLAYEGFYKGKKGNMSPFGSFKKYYKNGQLEAEGNFDEDGIWKYYYENGQLQLEVNKVKGKEEGLLKEYYKNGQLKKTTNYRNGKKHGESKEYHEDGQVKFDSMYKNGEEVYNRYYDTQGNFVTDLNTL